MPVRTIARCDYLASNEIRRWSSMCNERWLRRRQRREERFDEELRYLIDEERPSRERPTPVVLEHEQDEEPRDPERVRVEAGARS
jgi:hypothetical protein